MRLLTVFCVAALAIAVATPAFAAVQNIKVSGEVGAKAIFLADYDLKHESVEDTTIPTGPTMPAGRPVAYSGLERDDDDDSFILSTVKVGIDSDLTDNVSTAIVLANQTRWGDAAAVGAIDLNTAYITMKEFFYSPLTLKIGRQPLIYGHGLIIGPGLFRDPSGAFVQTTDTIYDVITRANVANVPVSGTMGAQYSISNNYDAIRAIVDLDPWTVEGVIAMLDETDVGRITTSGDEYLTGFNIGYKFDNYNADVEGYYFYNRDDSFNSTLGYVRQQTIQGQAAVAGPNYPENAAASLDGGPGGNAGLRAYEENIVHVIGARGDIEPLESLVLSGECAFQFGDLRDDMGPWGASTSGGPLERDRRAWALNIEGSYAWPDVVYKPNAGVGYVFLSGEEAENGGNFDAWDPMCKGKFFSAIRDFQAGDQVDWLGNDGVGAYGSQIYATRDQNDSAGSTNSHILFIDGGLKPMEDLTLKARYLHFWFHERPVSGRDRSIGDEVDASLVYDYTEDVQFDVTGAWFVPGDYYDGAQDLIVATDDANSKDTASSITGSVRVAF